VGRTITYTVPDMTCARCTRAVSRELSAVPGVTEVEVDLETKLLRVSGEDLDDASLRTAIEAAGYEVAP
jgi:copper chaperone